MKKTPLLVAAAAVAVIALLLLGKRETSPVTSVAAHSSPPPAPKAQPAPPQAVSVAVPAPPAPEPTKAAAVGQISASVGAADPEAMAQKLRPQRARAVEQMYGAMFQELGWPAATSTTFRDIYVSHLESGDRLLRELMPAGGTPDKVTKDVMNEKLQVEFEQRVQSALGDGRLKEVLWYDATMPVRSVVNELASSLLYGPDALDPSKAQQLVRLIAENSPTRDGKSDVRSANTGAIISRSASLLNPAQVSSLQRVLDARTSTSRLSIGSDRQPPK